MLPGITPGAGMFGGVRGPVTSTYVTHNAATVSGTSHTFSGISIGTAFYRRVVFVAVAVPRSVTAWGSVTLGGTTMTQVGEALGTYVDTVFLQLEVDTGTTADLVVNWTGTPTGMAYTVYTLENAYGITPTHYPADTDAMTTTWSGIDVDDNSTIIAHDASFRAADQAFTWTGTVGVTKQNDAYYPSQDFINISSANKDFTTGSTGMTISSAKSQTVTGPKGNAFVWDWE